MKAKRSKSNSLVQRSLEASVRRRLAKLLNWPHPLQPHSVPFGKGRMEFDCYGEHNGIILLAEINAHHGALKVAQKNKVLRDIFKMFAYSAEQYERPGVRRVRMVAVFTCLDAAAFLGGDSWAAEVARRYGVESVAVSLTRAEVVALLKAQKHQDLRN